MACVCALGLSHVQFFVTPWSVDSSVHGIFQARILYANVKSLQSCPTLCDPIDGSPPGSSVHRTPQASILEWVAVCGVLFPPPGDLPNPGVKPLSPESPALTGGFFTTEPPGKPNSGLNNTKVLLSI